MNGNITIFGGCGSIDPHHIKDLNDHTGVKDIGIYNIVPYIGHRAPLVNIPHNGPQYTKIKQNINNPSTLTSSTRFNDIKNKYPNLNEYIANDTETTRTNRYFYGTLVTMGDPNKIGLVIQLYFRHNDNLVWYRSYDHKNIFVTPWVKLYNDTAVDYEILENGGADGALITLPKLREVLEETYNKFGTTNADDATMTELRNILNKIYIGDTNLSGFIKKNNPTLDYLELPQDNDNVVIDGRYDATDAKRLRVLTNESKIVNFLSPDKSIVTFYKYEKDKEPKDVNIRLFKDKMNLSDGDNVILLGAPDTPVVFGSVGSHTIIESNELDESGHKKTLELNPTTEISEEIKTYKPTPTSDGLRITIPDYINKNAFVMKISSFDITDTNAGFISKRVINVQYDKDQYGHEYYAPKYSINWKNFGHKMYSETLDILGDGVYYLSYNKYRATDSTEYKHGKGYGNTRYLNSPYTGHDIYTKYKTNSIDGMYVAYSKGDIWVEVKGNEIIFKVYDELDVVTRSKLINDIREFSVSLYNITGGRL